MADALSTILETTQAERLATGFGFTEGPLWDPTNGCYYFVDLRRNRLYRLTPGKEPEVVREQLRRHVEQRHHPRPGGDGNCPRAQAESGRQLELHARRQEPHLLRAPEPVHAQHLP